MNSQKTMCVWPLTGHRQKIFSLECKQETVCQIWWRLTEICGQNLVHRWLDGRQMVTSTDAEWFYILSNAMHCTVQTIITWLHSKHCLHPVGWVTERASNRPKTSCSDFEKFSLWNDPHMLRIHDFLPLTCYQDPLQPVPPLPSPTHSHWSR